MVENQAHAILMRQRRIKIEAFLKMTSSQLRHHLEPTLSCTLPNESLAQKSTYTVTLNSLTSA